MVSVEGYNIWKWIICWTAWGNHGQRWDCQIFPLKFQPFLHYVRARVRACVYLKYVCVCIYIVLLKSPSKYTVSPRGLHPVRIEPLAENNGGSALCISPSGRLGGRVPKRRTLVGSVKKRATQYNMQVTQWLQLMWKYILSTKYFVHKWNNHENTVITKARQYRPLQQIIQHS